MAYPKLAAFGVLFALAAAPAWAQSCLTTGDCATSIMPPNVTVQGTITAGNNTSTTLASGGVTLDPGSAAFPTGGLPQGTVTLQNDSSSVNVQVCWLGNPCVVGMTLAPGASRTMKLQNFKSSPPSFFGVGGTAVISFFM